MQMPETAERPKCIERDRDRQRTKHRDTEREIYLEE